MAKHSQSIIRNGHYISNVAHSTDGLRWYFFEGEYYNYKEYMAKLLEKHKGTELETRLLAELLGDNNNER